MTIVLTGGSGVLGRALTTALPQALAPTRNELDLLDERTSETYLRSHAPSAIVHAAALTDVRRCEADRELAWRVNVGGTSALLRVVREVTPDCYFIYVSTAGVFRGDAGNYGEESLPDPVNYYGVTKWKGEKEVLRHDLTCVVRTNFVRRGKWPHPYAFGDRYGTFLYDTGAARGICDVLAARLTGIVHICGSVRLSLYELAKQMDPEVKPMSLDGYHGPPLTRDMSLVTHRWRTYTLSD